MFSQSKFRFNKPLFGGKRKNYSRNLVFLNRRRHHDHDYRDRHNRDDSVMMSGDSPGLDSRSIPASYDLPDDARPGELPPVIPLSSTGKLSHSNHDSGSETIEEVTTIVKKTLPSPEPRPKIYQKNGIDSDNNNKLKLENKFAENNKEDNDACVNCLYYTQQFCECVIL
ncbi:uncharacterized protein LOC141528558 isoform X1 [Cotesia typhae]|uniref:uncharacterized protein LOC141528558 isoform X1 n=1 Tax=Cotesia typhae TaxID=2053667 RepID=UPI003D684312